MGGQLDVLETRGVLGASRTDGDPAVGHGFMVTGQSDRDVPIPRALLGYPNTPDRSAPFGTMGILSARVRCALWDARSARICLSSTGADWQVGRYGDGAAGGNL